MKKKYYTSLIIFFLGWLFFAQAQTRTTESFSDAIFPPKNWTVKYAHSKPHPDNFMSLSTTEKFGGTGSSFRFSSSQNQQGAPYTQYLISPELSVQEVDSLSVRYYVPSFGSRYFKIGCSSTTPEIDQFTWTAQQTAEDYEWGGYWKEYLNINIPAGTKYICIQYCPTSASVNTYFYIDNVKLPPLAMVNCDMPANLRFNTQSSTVMWKETGNADNWEVVYGNVDNFDLHAAQVHSTADTSLVLENLSPLSTYVVYVRSLCELDQKSAWSAPLYFRTGCPDYYELPWSEGFENIPGDIIPDCQKASNMSAFSVKRGANTYNLYENRKPQTGNNYAYFNNTNSTSYTSNWYFSPSLKMQAGNTYKLSFSYICEEGIVVDSLAIGVGSTQTPETMRFIKVERNPKNTEYREFSAMFLAEQTGNYVMGIYYKGVYSKLSADSIGEYLSIDNLLVREQSNLESPQNFMINKYKTTEKQIELSWTEVSGAMAWELSIGRLNKDFNPADSILSLVSSNPYILQTDAKGNPLLPNTEYRVYVRSVQGGNQSAWAGPIVIKTLKEATAAFPLLEDFSSLEGSNKMTENLQWISNLEGRLRTTTSNNTYNKYYGRNDSKFLYTSLPNTTGAFFDEWIILRGAKLSAGVSYDFSCWLLTDEKSGIDSVEIRIGDLPYPEKMNTVLCKEIKPMHKGYKELMASYTPEESKTVYMAVRIMARSTVSYNNVILSLDDIQIKKTPTCRMPRELLVVDTYADSVKFSWQHDESPMEWTLAFAQGKSLDIARADTLRFSLEGEKEYILKNLLPNTTYTLALKANCEEGVSSAWSIPITFTSLCSAHTSFPLNEGFEAYTSSCWSSQGYRDGNERPSAQWNSYKGESQYAGMDVEPFEGDSSLRFRSSFEDNKSYGELISPELEMNEKEISSLEFYWWNKGSCSGDDESGLYPFPTQLYLSYTLNGSDYVLFDSIQACGCANSRTAYRKYERIFPHTVKRYKIKAVGNFGSSNTHLDALSIKAFDTADISAPKNLQATVQQTDVSLVWTAVPTTDHSLMNLKYYEIKRNGVFVDTTSKVNYQDKSLAKGNYNYEVYAVYTSGLKSRPISAQAQITVETFQVLISKNEIDGTIAPEAGNYNYVEGSSLSLNAQGVNLLTEFKYWVVNTSDTIRNAQTSLTVNKAMTIKAVFAEIMYHVNISARGKGEITPPIGSTKYKGGTTLELTANPEKYWEFKYWIINQDSLSHTLAQTSVLLTENLNITAVFEKIPYTLSMRKNGEGSTTPSEGTHHMYAGDTIQLDAQATKGHKFVKWIISTQSVNEQKHSFVLERNTTVNAYFEELPQFTVAISKVGEGGLTPLVGNHTYYEGDTLKLSAKAAASYSFQKWVINGKTILAPDTSFTVKENLQIQAYFIEVIPKKYTLTISKIGQGGLTPQEGEHEYTEGENVNLQAVAAEDWVFVAWIINGDSVKTAQTSWTANADATAVAIFHEQLGIENHKEAGVDIYPNPTKNYIYIQSELGLSQIEIYSLDGQKVYTRQYFGETKVHISLVDFKEGMYFVKVITKNKSHYLRKLIKK